jgi:uncharacterized membrane protein YgaE (UPF0421/DUF939 family)
MRNKYIHYFLFLLTFSIILALIFVFVFPSENKQSEEIELNLETQKKITQHTYFLREKCLKSLNRRKNMQQTLMQLNDYYKLGIEITNYEDINIDNLNDKQLIYYDDIEATRMSELRRIIRKIDHAAGQIQHLQMESMELPPKELDR